MSLVICLVEVKMKMHGFNSGVLRGRIANDFDSAGVKWSKRKDRFLAALHPKRLIAGETMEAKTPSVDAFVVTSLCLHLAQSSA